MKYIFIVLFAGQIFSGCNNTPALNEAEALQTINNELKYPRVVDYDIYRSDPAHAKKLLDAGLEANGMVIVQKTQKLKNIGSPLITFTEAARSHLLPVSDKERALDIQKVKIADEVVTAAKINAPVEDKNSIVVDYTTVYKNTTPFAILMTRDINEPVKHTVAFVLQGDNWVIKKR